jgi:membrane associated rhomboid family serine protease
MLRALSLAGFTIGAILSLLSIVSAFYTFEVSAFAATVAFGAMMMLSGWGLSQTRPLGKVLPSAEPAKMRLFKELRKIKSVHLRAPLALSALLILIHAALVFTGRISFLPSVDQLHSVGAAFGFSSAQGQVWRLFSGLFIHHSAGQLLCNILGILTMGRLLDYLVGWKSFLMIYVLGGIGASLASSVIYPEALIAGPTGAIFAIYGTVVVSLLLSRKMKRIDVPNSVIFGASIQAISSVAPGYALHFGGLILGFVVGLAWFMREKDVLLRRYAMASTALALFLLSVTVVPRLSGTKHLQMMAAIESNGGGRGPASIPAKVSAVSSMESKLWASFESAQESLKNSRWLKNAVVPTIEGGIAHIEIFHKSVVKPMFIKTKVAKATKENKEPVVNIKTKKSKMKAMKVAKQ